MIIRFVTISLIILLLFNFNVKAQNYYGELLLKALPDGRNMEIIKNFGFEDKLKRKWEVPSGWTVDGASIPQPLWSFIGGPFSGKYRNASVIHDYYCDIKTRPWYEVHEIFYQAMLASKVDRIKAKIMYLAVYRFGPRWDFTIGSCPPGAQCEVFTAITIEEFNPKYKEIEFKIIQNIIEKNPELSLDEMKRKLDKDFYKDAFYNAKR